MKIAYVGIIAGSAVDYGTFTVDPTTYKQRTSSATNLYDDSVSVTASKSFSPFTKYAMIPQGASSGTFADGFVYVESDKTIKFSRTFLDGLTAGYYDLYGTTASGQVKLGSVDIKSNSGTYTVHNSPYTQFASSEADQFASNLYVTSDSPLSLFTSYSLVPQGSTSGISTDGYTRSSADKTAVSFSRNLLDNIAAGAYEIYGITSGGQQIKLGNAEIKSNNGSFTVAPAVYTQRASSKPNQYEASVSVVANETDHELYPVLRLLAGSAGLHQRHLCDQLCQYCQ